MTPVSREFSTSFSEAQDIAWRLQENLSSAHLLLALFTFPNRAKLLLEEQKIEEDLVLSKMANLPIEPKGNVNRLKERALFLAKGLQAKEVDCLHLLVTFLRVKESLAYELLERTGVSLSSLRNIVVSYVTNGLPKRFLDIQKLDIQKKDIRKKDAQKNITPTFRSAVSMPLQTQLIQTPYDKTLMQPPMTAVKESFHQPRELREKKETVSFLENAAFGFEEIVKEEKEEASSFTLEKSEYPLLCEIGRNLVGDAHLGKIDDVILREEEITKLIDILGQKRSNNPCLVGPSGVGKTAIVEGLARLIAMRSPQVKNLHQKTIIEIPLGSILSGTSLRGALSEKLSALQNEVKKAQGNIIVFIDEIHALLGANSNVESAGEVANELKAALARGEFPCIGATTDNEFRKFIEYDKALERRFSIVEVLEPSVEQCIRMVLGAIPAYEEHHQVTYDIQAIESAVQLSFQYIPERHLPEKAFSILDLAGSKVHRLQRGRVLKEDIVEIVSTLADVPKDILNQLPKIRLEEIESFFKTRLIGQDQAIASVTKTLKRTYAFYSKQKPLGSFLFLGQTGVGKTELAKLIAQFLFGNENAMVRIDATELSESHSVSKLIGSPPGYIGYQEGGLLTEALRKRPFQVVLIDEFEKAHHDVKNLLLQILDEGHLTDQKGKKVKFNHCVVILTSNAGSEVFAKQSQRSIGFDSGFDGGFKNIEDFGTQENSSQNVKLENEILKSAQTHFSPELWNRIDEKLVFYPLDTQSLTRIAKILLEDLALVLKQQRNIDFKWTKEVLEKIVESSANLNLGARPLKQAISRLIEPKLAEVFLQITNIQNSDGQASGKVSTDAKSIESIEISIDKDNNVIASANLRQ